MAGSGSQISSLHLAVAAGGGVMLYAALRGVSPLQAIRDVASGAPPAVSTQGKTLAGPDFVPEGSGTGQWSGNYSVSRVGVQSSAAFIVAANAHASETYSQADRWGKGHSDCSSFVGKSLMDIGITPPGASVTGDYLASADWRVVSSPKMGDLAVNAQHMVIFMDGSSGIGQENSRRNVQRDTVDNLMANSGSWQIRRWRGW